MRNYVKITEVSEEMTGDKTKFRANSLTKKQKFIIGYINNSVHEAIEMLREYYKR